MKADKFKMPPPPRGHEWNITPGSVGGWVERGTPAVTITLRTKWAKKDVAWRGAEATDEGVHAAARWILQRMEQDERNRQANANRTAESVGRYVGVWK